MKECQRCKEVGEDRRTLWMRCLYDMDEIGLPFKHEFVGKQKFYTLCVCKTCRGLWMAMQAFWFNLPDNKRNAANGSGIYVRELGATIEISEEEWYKRNPGIEPVRFKDE